MKMRHGAQYGHPANNQVHHPEERRLDVRITGQPEGIPLVFHHGTPEKDAFNSQKPQVDTFEGYRY